MFKCYPLNHGVQATDEVFLPKWRGNENGFVLKVESLTSFGKMWCINESQGSIARYNLLPLSLQSEWEGGRRRDRECEWRKTRQLCVLCYAQLKEPNQAANQMSGSGLLGEPVICMAFSGKATWQLASPKHAVRLANLHKTCLLTAFKLLLWNLLYCFITGTERSLLFWTHYKVWHWMTWNVKCIHQKTGCFVP